MTATNRDLVLERTMMNNTYNGHGSREQMDLVAGLIDRNTLQAQQKKTKKRRADAGNSPYCY